MPDHDSDFERRLTQRLRAYEARIPDLDAPAPGTKARRPAPSWPMIGGGAAALVAGSVLALVLINSPPVGIGEGIPSLSPHPSRLPGASPSHAIPSPTVSPEALSSAATTDQPASTPLPKQFTQVATFPGANGSALTAWPHGWAAIGRLGANPAVWLSADGAHWEAIVPTGLEDGAVNHLVTIPDGRLLAIGFRFVESSGGTETAWISTDGRDWRETDLGISDLRNAQDVAAGPLGMVLVGLGDLNEGAVSNSYVWYSADGIIWDLVWETLEDESPVAVGAGPEGFVVVGSQGYFEGDPQGFALASSDGREWVEAPQEVTLAQTRGIWNIVPIGGDWIAAPAPAPTDIALLRSANGLDWSADSSLPLASARPDHVAGLEGDGRFVLFGATTYGEPMTIRLFVDGKGWQETPAQYRGGIRVASQAGLTVLMVAGAEEAPELEFWVAATPQ
jgi:hypothetical protein